MMHLGTIASYDITARTGVICAQSSGEMLPFRQSDLSHYLTAPTVGACYDFERRWISWGSHRAVRLRPTSRDFAIMPKETARQQRG